MTYQYSQTPDFRKDLMEDASSSFETISLINRQFVRIERPENAVYVDPEGPYWFAPSSDMDRLIMDVTGGNIEPISINDVEALDTVLDRLLSFRSFLGSIQAPKPEPYTGRHGRRLGKLNELWLHITDKCNLSCSHCLFSERLTLGSQLDTAQIRNVIGQTVPLGLSVVCLTGGEPLIHPDFTEIISFLLKHEGVRGAILTNGLLYEKHSHFLKRLDKTRLTFQVSVDGSERTHDAIRGHGAYGRVIESVSRILSDGFGCSLAMSVNKTNVPAMTDFIIKSSLLGIRNVHFLWHFKKGKGSFLDCPDISGLVKEFREVIEVADRTGVVIDNVEAIRSQVLTHTGTRFDLGSAGWDSLSVGPDLGIYPSPATIGVAPLWAGDCNQGIESVWRESPVLKTIRSFSMNQVPAIATDPLRFLTGGGDIDHCMINHISQTGETGIGDDPFRPLYNEIALRVIEKEIEKLPGRKPGAALELRMGDVVHDCHNDPEVNFTHSNCLLTLAIKDGEGYVRGFYGDRAEQTDETILNPVSFDKSVSELIPEFALARRYGCGSPVHDTDLSEGETIVDLGCGTGIELFLASRIIGPTGRAIGVDMTGPMLDLAVRANEKVTKRLGYDNICFLQGVLEDIPLPDNLADVVISNCVVNLCRNKRKVFMEIFRILKPGGRFVISDVVCDSEPPLQIRNDPKLSGECLGGALRQEYLFSMIKDAGFCNSSVLKKFPYRTVMDHQFFSLTFRGFKPPLFGPVVDGPDSATGRVSGSTGFTGCGCYHSESQQPATNENTGSGSGCVVCGAPLVYIKIAESRRCNICGKYFDSLSTCENNHFVCDNCHSSDPLLFVESSCISSTDTDMIGLLKKIRRIDGFPINGPEHHSLAPAIILTSFRNLGGCVTANDIREAIRRGKLVAGGSCASLGICGAATGVGIAVSIIGEATPLTPNQRQSAMLGVSSAAKSISSFKVARCCQRECYLALKQAAKMSQSLCGIRLPADDRLICSQHHKQQECAGADCPLYPAGI